MVVKGGGVEGGGGPCGSVSSVIIGVGSMYSGLLTYSGLLGTGDATVKR